MKSCSGIIWSSWLFQYLVAISSNAAKISPVFNWITPAMCLNLFSIFAAVAMIQYCSCILGTAWRHVQIYYFEIFQDIAMENISLGVWGTWLIKHTRTHTHTSHHNVWFNSLIWWWGLVSLNVNIPSPAVAFCRILSRIYVMK